MKYKNASEILPDKLLRELQKYAAGEVVYIPTGKRRKQWGSGSGTRAYYRQRNEDIKEKYRRGAAVGQLAEEYGLSDDTIRKILYK